jgi:tetratricopeptide (TPR) repeat protein
MSDHALTDGVDRLAEADAALAAGRLDEALYLATGAVELLAAAHGPDHPDTANATLTVSAVYERAGEFAEARHAAMAATGSLDRHAGCGVSDVAMLRVNAMLAVGNLDRVLGDLDAASAILGRAVAVAEVELGPDHLATAGAYNTLGIVGKFAARFDDAERAYRRALAVYELHDDRLGMAAVLHNLAGLEHERGRPDAGIPFGERGLAMREAVLGPDHYEVAVVCGNLALALTRQAKTGAAEALYRRALAGKRVALGPDHPDLAVTLHNLGVLLVDTDRRNEGMELLHRAESVLAARLPEDHPRRAAVRGTLARLR